MHLRAAIIAAWLCAMPAFAAADDPFYNREIVQTIELGIAPGDLERLKGALPKRISVPGSFRWKDQTLKNVAIRYKGNSSSNPDSNHKRGFVIDFAELEKGRRFLGLRHVSLDNGIQFGSLFSQRLISDILRDLDIKAPRCNYSRVFLNKKFIGVYVNEERIDKVFLERTFEDESGPLFKVDEGGPASDLRYLGEDVTLYRRAFELQSGKDREAYPQLAEFIRLLDRPALDESDLRQNFELEPFLKVTAVMLLSGAFDQYTGWGAHNFYLYRDPKAGRWNYLPWDLDVGFADRAFNKVPVLDGWNAAWPAPVPNRPLMEQLVTHEALLRVYREHAKVILEKYFHPDVLIPKLHALHDQIRKDLAEDPFPARRATNPADKSYEDILAGMEAFIRRRYDLARAQLAAPGLRPSRMHEITDAQESPRPGPASPDAPTNLQATRISDRGIELTWTDNADNEFAHVVQRATGRNSTNFANVIGLPGPTVTNATDQTIEPGKAYRYRVYAVFPTPQGPRGSGVSNTITVDVPAK